MSRTDVLVRNEFLTWLKDRLKEEAERKEQSARTRDRSLTLARMRTSVVMGLSLIAVAASSIL